MPQLFTWVLDIGTQVFMYVCVCINAYAFYLNNEYYFIIESTGSSHPRCLYFIVWRDSNPKEEETTLFFY